jgi:hypothetical protein
MKSCRNCQFYTGDRQDGLCVRYPPVVVTGQQIAQFPTTRADYFCGEFKDMQHADIIERNYNAPGSAFVDEFTRATYPTGSRNS